MGRTSFVSRNILKRPINRYIVAKCDGYIRISTSRVHLNVGFVMLNLVMTFSWRHYDLPALACMISNAYSRHGLF
jgi:hypothetical protein